MKRRDIILAGAALATGGGVTALLNGEKKALLNGEKKGQKKPETEESNTVASPNIIKGIKEFRMATSWPKDFPGLGIMPVRFAEALKQMSDGRLQVRKCIMPPNITGRVNPKPSRFSQRFRLA